MLGYTYKLIYVALADYASISFNDEQLYALVKFLDTTHKADLI